MKVLHYPVIFIIIASCSNQNQFDSRKLKGAWVNDDSTYVAWWINNLDTVGSFNRFASLVADLAHETNFCYGYLDLEINWDTVPDIKKEILKDNILTVYRLYCQSEIFMDKKVLWDTTLQIQENYFLLDRKLNEVEQNEIRQQFNKWHTQFN